MRGVVWSHLARGVLDSDIAAVSQSVQVAELYKVRWGIHRKIVVRCLGRALAGDEATPRLMALVYDFSGIFLVLRLAGERKLVFGLAIGDFVDTVWGGIFFFEFSTIEPGIGLPHTGTTHSWRV